MGRLKNILLILLLTACTENKFSDLSNKDLAEKQTHCDSVKKKAPGFAVGCENIRKEIERRKNEKK